MSESVARESFASSEDTFKPHRFSIEDAIFRLDVIDELHDLPSGKAFIDEILAERPLTAFQRRSAYEHLDKYCRDAFETEYGPFDQIEVPDDLVVILQNDIEKLGDPDILAWAADLYVHIPDRFDDVIKELGIDKVDVLKKLNSVIPHMELALLFIADRQGFRKQDAIFGSAMAAEVRSGHQIVGEDYKDVHKMLSLKQHANLLHEIGIDTRIIPNERRSEEEDGSSEDHGPSVASMLVHLAEKNGATFWTSDSDMPYVTFWMKDHLESHPLASRYTRNWLSYLMHDNMKKTPKSSAVSDAIGQLEGLARFEGDTHQVYVRMAEHSGKFYLDLCDDQWQAVEIDDTEWRVIQSHQVPVKFRRARGMKALPVPIKGGSFDNLRDIMNISDDDMWLLLKGWVVGAFNPNGPFPPLIFNGEPGSIKTTRTRLIRRLIDPNAADVRRLPKSERDLMISASNSWVQSFDNISRLSKDMSDAICVLATGGGLANRELYSDADESLLDAKRPIILNGIDSITSKADMISRAIIMHVPKVSKKDRKTERVVYKKFNEILPGVLGSILDIVSHGIKELPNVKLNELSRMADFEVWVTACEGKLGCDKGKFSKVYEANQESAYVDLIENDTVLGDLVDYLQKTAFVGTATDLLTNLRLKYIQGKRGNIPIDYPKNGQSLSGKLKRNAGALHAMGIEVEFKRDGKARTIIIGTPEAVATIKNDPGTKREGDLGKF